MAYFVIEDFHTGLDKRRMEQATPAGALITLQNAVINRGGEVDKAKKFAAKYMLPAGTFGLAALGSALYVFGSGADPGVPAGVTYQQLAHEGALAMTELLNADVFAGQIFATAQYSDGSRRAFNNGTIVAGLQSGSGTIFAGLVLSTAVLTYKNKEYLTSGTNLLFSKSGDAAIFDEATSGSGLIDQSLYVSKDTDIVGLASYQNSLAVFSSENVAIWAVDPDPTAYDLIQILPNIGTIAPRSVRSFGDHDVFFLSDTGVRSLRAINSSLAAGVSDVGTPIDDLIIAKIDELSAEEVRIAAAIIEPKDGRYFLGLGDTIFAFSYFPLSKVSAWSTMDTGFNITYFAKAEGRLYARAGNEIYLFGGDNNDEYTDQPVIVETPYLDARSIATWKEWIGIDLILEGLWDVYINTNPNMPDEWTLTARVFENTTEKKRISLEARAPAIKLKFVHQGEGRARLSKIIVHYKGTRESG